MSKNFLSASQYAARLGVSKRRVEVLAAKGRLKGAQRLGAGPLAPWIIPEGCPDPRKPAGHPPAPDKKKAPR
jgi:hypothetical protein